MSGGDEAQSNPGGPEDQGVEWYLARDGKQYGPLSDTEMMKLVEFGHLKSADLVWRAGFADWTAAIAAFPQAFAPPPPPQPRAPSPPTEPQPQAPRPIATGIGRDEPMRDSTPRDPRPAQRNGGYAPRADVENPAATHPAATHPAWQARAAEADVAAQHPSAQHPSAGARNYQPARSGPQPGSTPGPRPGSNPGSRPGTQARAPSDIGWPDVAAPEPAPRPQPVARGGAANWPGAGPLPAGDPAQQRNWQPPVSQPPMSQPPGGEPVVRGEPSRGRSAGPHVADDPRLDPRGPAPHPRRERSGSRQQPDEEPGTGPILEEEHFDPPRRRGGLVATLVLVLLLGLMGAGVYGLAVNGMAPDFVVETLGKLGISPGAIKTSTSVSDPRVGQPADAASGAAAPARNAPPAAPPVTVNYPPSPDAFDAQLQASPVWQIVKADYPTWYAERVKDGARRAAENQDGASVHRYLLEQLVTLRREHARSAFVSTLPHMKAVAQAFRDNLVSLAQHSEVACYSFISMGEASRGIAALHTQPRYGPLLEAQAVAVLTAIREGQKAPTVHMAPRKDDYTRLSAELKDMGWSEDDLKLFADSDGLAKTDPGRVCRMVTDWFSAQLKIRDPDLQSRLLSESIKPVVGG